MDVKDRAIEIYGSVERALEIAVRSQRKPAMAYKEARSIFYGLEIGEYRRYFKDDFPKVRNALNTYIMRLRKKNQLEGRKFTSCLENLTITRIS